MIIHINENKNTVKITNFDASNLEELIALNPYNTNITQNQIKTNSNFISNNSKKRNMNINLGSEILSVVGDVDLNQDSLFPLDLLSVPVNPALVQPLQNTHQQQGLCVHQAKRHEEQAQLLTVRPGRVKEMHLFNVLNGNFYQHNYMYIL